MLEKGRWVEGVTINGVNYKGFELRPLRVRDYLESTGAEDNKVGLEIYAKRLTLVPVSRPAPPVTAEMVADLIEFDFQQVVAADKRLTERLKEELRGEENPAPENPEAA